MGQFRVLEKGKICQSHLVYFSNQISTNQIIQNSQGKKNFKAVGVFKALYIFVLQNNIAPNP
jgi:hypothetical protein